MLKGILEKNTVKELERQYSRGTEFMIALVEFPPNGASYLGECPNAEYAGCRRGEARCSDSIPRALLDWLNAKETAIMQGRPAGIRVL